MESISPIILQQLKDGDSQAFTVIFERYWKVLFAVAYRRLGDETLAQDMVQEVFMNIWDKREDLNISTENVEFYLLKSIKNKIINYYSSQRVRQDVLRNVMYRMQMIVNEQYDRSRYIELERFVDEQVDSFPNTMKAVFLMKSDGHSIKSIAEKLNIAEQTVKNSHTETSRRLKAAILKKFSDEEMAILFVAALMFT